MIEFINYPPEEPGDVVLADYAEDIFDNVQYRDSLAAQNLEISTRGATIGQVIASSMKGSEHDEIMAIAKPVIDEAVKFQSLRRHVMGEIFSEAVMHGIENVIVSSLMRTNR
jgi:hypothetical protein